MKIRVTCNVIIFSDTKKKLMNKIKITKWHRTLIEMYYWLYSNVCASIKASYFGQLSEKEPNFPSIYLKNVHDFIVFFRPTQNTNCNRFAIFARTHHIPCSTSKIITTTTKLYTDYLLEMLHV